MKRWFIISILLLVGMSETHAQKYFRAIGIETGYNFSNWVVNGVSTSKRFSLQPIMYLGLDSFSIIKVSAGYTKFWKDSGQMNFDYVSKGEFIKVGYSFQPFYNVVTVNPGVNLTYAIYSESGKYYLHGNYFGDLVGRYQRKNLDVLLLEPNVDFICRLNKCWRINLNVGIPFILLKSYSGSSPNFYIPGAGSLTNKNRAIDLSFFVIYSFR